MESGNHGDEVASNPTRPPRRRVLATLLVLAAVGFVGSTLTLFLLELFTDRNPPSKLGAEFKVDDAQAPADCLGATDQQKAIVSLVVRSLDREAQTLTLDVGLCLPPALKNRLVSADGTPVHIFGRANTRVKPEFAGLPLRVEWTTGLPDRSGPRALPEARHTTLGKLNNARRGDQATFGRIVSPVVSLGQLVLPLNAAPRRYPDDWYVLSGSLELTIGGSGVGLPRKPGSGVPRVPQEWLPFRISVGAAAGVAALRGAASVSSPDDSRTRELNIQLTRSGAVQTYVWIVAFIPLVLAFMLVVAMDGRTEHGPVRVEGLTGYTAALLAVLPIRLVLVPASTPELTLVDYWLGFEMAVLVAVAIIAERRGL